MDTIEINVAVDSSPVFAAINAFEQLEQTVQAFTAMIGSAFAQISTIFSTAFIALQQNAVTAFTILQEQLNITAEAIQAPQQESSLLDSSLAQTTLSTLNFAASLVQLSATNTALGAALKLLGGVYVGFEKVLGGVFRGVLGFSKLMGRLSVLLASGALQAVLALGKGLLVGKRIFIMYIKYAY